MADEVKTEPAVDTATAATAPPAADTVETVTLAKSELESMRAALKAANKEAQDRRLKLEELDAAQKKAEDERLAKQGEFEKLANDRAADLETTKGEVKALTAEVTSLRELANQQVDEGIKDWPESVKNLIPSSEDADPLTRLRAMQKAKPAAEELMSKNGQPVRPSAPNLDALAGGTRNGTPPEEARQAMAVGMGYNR